MYNKWDKGKKRGNFKNQMINLLKNVRMAIDFF